jgi:L-alanine-DL-glutamate epimerase-like enolase superfamily enzyme
MKIDRITISYYKWERAMPITNGLHTYSGVGMCSVRIDTQEGAVGYGVGGSKPGEREFREHFAKKLIGMNPLMTEAIWAKYWMPKATGRRGFETRALASMDLACWDLKGRVANMPVHQMIGGFRDRIPTYVAGGYYAPGKSVKDLQAEMTGYVERGAKAVKMKIGAVSIAEDVVRVKAVRQAIGPNVKLMIDANCAYRAYQAVQIAKQIEDQDIFWFEEAVQPDDYDGFAYLAQRTSIPLATGENESTKYGFRDLLATKAIAIIQPDARHQGITEFMKIAALAQTHGIDLCPHGDQQAHLSLMAAIPNGLFIEYYPKEFDPMHGRTYLHTPMLESDGCIAVPQVAGLGTEVDADYMQRYKTSEITVDRDAEISRKTFEVASPVAVAA